MQTQSSHTNQPQTNLPTPETGNASNPTPQQELFETPNNSLLGDKAEKYLRESGNIEDMPDPQEQQNAEDTLREVNNNETANEA